MTRLTKLQKFAPKYKTITIPTGDGEVKLEVRMPLKAEVDAIASRISNPDPARVEAKYQELIEPIASVALSTDPEVLKLADIVVQDSDYIVKGSSVRIVSHASVMSEVRIEEYIALIRGEQDDEEPSTYDELVAELPEEFIRLLADKVESVIYPTYETARKN